MDHERYAEKLISEALARGELAPLHGVGEPLGRLENDPDWWVRSFLTREELPVRQRVLAEARSEQLALAVAADDLDEARAILAGLNAELEQWNREAPADHRFAPISEIWLLGERAKRPAP